MINCSRLYFGFLFLVSLFLMACSEEASEELRDPQKENIIEQIPQKEINIDEIWWESNKPVKVTKIAAFDEDYLYYLVVDENIQSKKAIGKTVSNTFDKEWVTEMDFDVKDFYPLRDISRDNPGNVIVGGYDNESLYISNVDIDSSIIAFSGKSLGNTSKHKKYFDYQYRTSLTSISLSACSRIYDWENDYFFAVGQAIDDTNVSYPFLAFFGYGPQPFKSRVNIYKTKVFDENPNFKFLDVIYFSKSLIISGINIETNKVSVILYKIIDQNNDCIIEEDDSFEQVWKSEIDSLIINSETTTFISYGYNNTVCLAGGKLNGNGNKQCYLVNLDLTSGQTNWTQTQKFESNENSFNGVITYGGYYFGFGYVKWESSDEKKKEGLVSQFSPEGETIKNYILKDSLATEIEFFSGSGRLKKISQFDSWGTAIFAGGIKYIEESKGIASKITFELD